MFLKFQASFYLRRLIISSQLISRVLGDQGPVQTFMIATPVIKDSSLSRPKGQMRRDEFRATKLLKLQNSQQWKEN